MVGHALQILRNHQIIYILCNVLWFFLHQLAQRSDHVFKGIILCIVLMHDSATTGTTAEALPSIIRWYKEEGYAFCTVSQLYDALE